MQIKLEKSDAHTVLQYFTSEQRAAGYTGHCFIDLRRLAEIHMEYSSIVTRLSIEKARRHGP